MSAYLTAYLATAVAFLAMDYVWLSRAIGFYRSSLGDVLADKPNFVAAAAFYLLYFIGIVVFVVMPAARGEGWITAVTLGGFFGLVAFATYDLTNLATLSRWSVRVAVVDMIWGACVTATAALAGFAALRLTAAQP